MNYYPHHIGDYASATAHLSLLEDGVYRRLLDWYYLDEKPLPADQKAIYRRVRAASDAEREAVDVVLAEFFTLSDGGYRHRRCDAEIAKSQAKSRERSAAAHERWKQKECKRDANAPPTNAIASGSDAIGMHSQEPIANNQTSEQSSSVRAPDGASKSPRTKRRPAEQPPDVPDDVWLDFLALRKSKGAELTDTGLAGIRREAEKAGMPLADALRMCCARGWQGFAADWLTTPTARQNAPPARTLTPSQQLQQTTIAGLTGRRTREDIDVDATEIHAPARIR
ncbi:MAG: YdaU family protein [Rhodospirillales bacterium]